MVFLLFPALLQGARAALGPHCGLPLSTGAQPQPPLPVTGSQEGRSWACLLRLLWLLLRASVRKPRSDVQQGPPSGDAASQKAGPVGTEGEACYKVAQQAAERGP